jgi:hypothetical protein
MTEKETKKGAETKPKTTEFQGIVGALDGKPAPTGAAAPESPTPVLDAGARLVTGVLGTVFRAGDRVLVATADEANKAGHAVVDEIERGVKKITKEP